VVWGDGTSTREFLYVEEAAEAIVRASELCDAPDPVNVGSGMEISIRDLVHLIAELTRYEGTVKWDTTRPNGQPRRALDTLIALSAPIAQATIITFAYAASGEIGGTVTGTFGYDDSIN
jgi:nucleoside-diphosphate-sugar epimerase